MAPLNDKLFSVTPATFQQVALEVFAFQYANVEIYRLFCDSLKCSPDNVKDISQIPFLPVELFKNHQVLAAGKQPQQIFESSGTTGSQPSRHYVADVELYEKSFLNAFHQFYGEPEDYFILGLLPSYLERNNSSLVYMVNRLMELTRKKESDFFLDDFYKLGQLLAKLRERRQRAILIGVTFGLLDFVERHHINYPGLIVMETGGMKGRREELTREEVHERLCSGFGVAKIHSEYGMTELLSQAYSKGDGIFNCPPWMKLITRDLDDPLRPQPVGSVGAINIIDLANLYSCSFIATNDIGRVNEDGSFEVRGRVDNADVRGCNLMVV